MFYLWLWYFSGSGCAKIFLGNPAALTPCVIFYLSHILIQERIRVESFGGSLGESVGTLLIKTTEFMERIK